MYNTFRKMWVDGVTYSINCIKKKESIIDFNTIKKHIEENSTNNIYPVETSICGKLYTSFHLHSYYCDDIKKCYNVMLKNLEEITNTIITLPKLPSDNLVILGDNTESITQARDYIHSVIYELREQYKPLQFISIPTVNEDVKNNFNIFKQKVFELGKLKGVEESIFQSPFKLHLTLSVLMLLSEREILECTNTLQEYKNKFLDSYILENGPIKLHVSGIDCMTTNLTNSHILYAHVKIINENDNETLQKFVNNIANYFQDKGLVTRPSEKVKIHLTLMNTKYRKNSNSKKRWMKRKPFNATEIINNLKDFDFGQCELNSIHVSLMSQIGDDGYYKPLSIIKF